jgi:hypothetical protein
MNKQATIKECNGTEITPSQQERGCVFCVVRAKWLQSRLHLRSRSRVDLSFETPARQDIGFGAEKLHSVESSELTVVE